MYIRVQWRSLHIFVYRDTIHNSQVMESAKLSIVVCTQQSFTQP